MQAVRGAGRVADGRAGGNSRRPTQQNPGSRQGLLAQTQYPQSVCAWKGHELGRSGVADTARLVPLLEERLARSRPDGRVRR